MFELEEVRTWERNPQLYADILASSLAAQALFAYAPATERARRVLSKLRQVPHLIQAARDNVKDPPGIFIKIGIETFAGRLTFIERDLPRAFAAVDDLHLLGDLADASAEASTPSGVCRLPRDANRRPKARGSFRLGREKFEQKLKLDEGIALAADRLLAIALARAGGTQDEFRAHRRAAERRAIPSRPGAGRRRITRARSRSRRPRSSSSTELAQFVERHKLVMRCPTASRCWSRRRRISTAGRSRACGRRARSRRKPTRALLLRHRRRPAWTAERQEEHLRDFNMPDALGHLDARVVSGSLPALSAPAAGRSKVRKSLFSRRRRSWKAGRTTASR